MGKPNAIIWDLDGTLADNSAQLHRFIQRAEAQGEEPDWNWWWTLLQDENWEPRAEAQTLFRLLHETEDDPSAIVVTARPSWLRGYTASWLSNNDFGYDSLCMVEPHMSWDGCKTEWVRRLKHGWNIQLAIDNSYRCCGLYRAEGIPAIHMAEPWSTEVSAPSRTGIL